MRDFIFSIYVCYLARTYAEFGIQCYCAFDRRWTRMRQVSETESPYLASKYRNSYMTYLYGICHNCKIGEVGR
ncbi:DASH complex subunit DAD3 [Histoplasma capsulatum var. duboisii H88]|uniref:DASH complex subunit DAD3 n=1 Tax=Ajellomyces capsulatus (strain H88) TaxID=544711 RepID=A0A8A1LKQ9_AJEC8|nr:DASH complex subunit DAD3 [Histoplasma capsulatum var. duboisii H88]